MRRVLFSCTLLAACAGLAQSASAENIFHRCWRHMGRDFARNNHWPEPFIYQDRDAVVRPFGVMIAKGWQVQNTLLEYHFRPADSAGGLTEAGVLKMQRILSDPAPQRRVVYVERGDSPQETATRIAAVQAAAIHHIPPGMQPQVYPTAIQARPWPAENVRTITEAYKNSQRKPALPAPSAGGGI